MREFRHKGESTICQFWGIVCNHYEGSFSSVRETKNCINSFLGFIAQHNSSVRGLSLTFGGFRLKGVDLNRSNTKRNQSEHLNVDFPLKG